jgi:hypothetical protein
MNGYSLFFKSVVALIIGAIFMLALSFTIYRKSYYYKKAQAEMSGTAQKTGLSSRLVTLAILLMMILFLGLFDLWVSSSVSFSFFSLVLYNLVFVALLSLFDALFIDLFLLVVWRPKLLGLPEGQPTRDSMLHHIKMQFTAGWLFKVPIAFCAAAISMLFGAGI